MTNSQQRLIQWLRDAHAMEMQAEKMLSRLSERVMSYPDIHVQIQKHLRETRTQADRVEQCLARLDADTSGLKDVTGKVMGMAQGISGLFVDDEIVKGCLASYTFENMEIASYRILIAAAEELGDRVTARTCADILAEEEAMAAWFLERLDPVTREYLNRETEELAN